MLENPAHAIPLWGLWQNYHRPNCSTLDGFSESVGDIGCRSLGNRIAGEDSARQGEGYPLGNMINACAHEVYLGQCLVRPGIVEIG
ncbi:hypothetical protein HMPREF9598_00087 [Cutibacterium acnes HL050PA1]|jgi:hypothetical protein|nr:hypothetical protein HMPREF9598_00087 [Cutibacterium acnes HL050PA1]MBM2807780.1 hypothetical protein [Cutibacterium acnes]